MSDRLPTNLIVSALLRRVNDAGGMAMVLAKGDPQAGSILVILNDKGRFTGMVEPGVGPAGLGTDGRSSHHDGSDECQSGILGVRPGLDRLLGGSGESIGSRAQSGLVPNHTDRRSHRVLNDRASQALPSPPSGHDVVDLLGIDFLPRTEAFRGGDPDPGSDHRALDKTVRRQTVRTV